MAVRSADVESELIDSVCECVREGVPGEQVATCENFIRQYYRWVPAPDLADRRPIDLCGTALDHWKLMQQREARAGRVRVYNPGGEPDSWQSSHTVIQLVSEDMPFLVDSVTMELGRRGHAIDLVIHPVVKVKRDQNGALLELLDASDPAVDGVVAESVMHMEIARRADRDELSDLEQGIGQVVGEVQRAVADWQLMRQRVAAIARELDRGVTSIEQPQVIEAARFLRWLAEDNFTFLGYREYELVEEQGEPVLRALADSGLGILGGPPRRAQTRLSAKAIELARAPHVLVLTKANSRSTVHRPSYLDYVGVKRYDADGNVVGERRFIGLYTTAAYKASLRQIPLLRGKVEDVLRRAGFPADSHDAKALLEILEAYPRDSLFQAEVDELFDVAMGILGLGERQRVRLFVRRDALDRFVECLVCIPRDRFNTENRERVAAILVDAFAGERVDWDVHLSESRLARVHYIVRRGDEEPPARDLAALENEVVVATRAWSDDLRKSLLDEHGEADGGRLYDRFARAFPAAYRADWTAPAAVSDIAAIGKLEASGEPVLSLYRREHEREGMTRCRLVSAGGVSLSDVLPTFEHLGAKVVDERPYEIKPDGQDPLWIYDFGLRCEAEDLEHVHEHFEEAFLGVWRGDLEDDGFNGLVLEAGLAGREIVVVRAVAKYLRQAGLSFSDSYVERTLLRHPDVAQLLVRLFTARFDPDERDPDAAERLSEEIGHKVDEVESLDEDRILRSFLCVLCSILRTNFFRSDARHLSFKLDPSQIPFLPRPRPRFEIFVYSPRVEGVHLRGGNVARGGLRWSDRREDFRTEVLGLMKAQMVKNALIVPVGSKGGFVVKRPPEEGGRDALMKEAVECYRTFLSGLLDLTDNIVDGDVVPPERVVRYDEDDPYLVVAADKGTASFSDIANEVSEQYRFWLGDAFASGGSCGYDHKEMGITARGAWESVKRHFRELGTDIQSTDFSVVGIGDMSGDVFGNGMLLSRHIRLLAAFDHMHVFLDPDPDPDASFEERKRLFGLGGSGWDDYDESLISVGGGVYGRDAKSIPISSQVREAIGVDADKLSPNDLVKAILRAPVDLLWNGGIGTYVKASSEVHGDAGDKANDTVRIDAEELRCKVVGEGGNLGFTQLGRIEFACAGGRINTDAIDNVAGVNCSDHEVNIKILLATLVDEGVLSNEQRNDLLVEMTGAVADQVLYGSYTQTQALSLARAQAASMVDVHERLIRHLEQVAGLDREIEFLPDDDQIAERKSNDDGLMAPELAVLMAYCKIHLYSALLDSDLPEDSFLAEDLKRYFPAPLPDRYGGQMRGHRLRREIIATVVANQLVDRAGTSFAFRLGEETGADASILARGYAVAREVFEMQSLWGAVEKLDNAVAADVQLTMLIEARRLVERATRWLVRANPPSIDISQTSRYFRPGAEMLTKALPDVLDGAAREAFDQQAQRLIEAEVPKDLARRIAGMPAMLSVFDIVEVASALRHDPEAVMHTYFRVASRLQINWLREKIIELPRTNRWQALARAALRDDLYTLHRSLTREVLDSSDPKRDSDQAIDAWTERNKAAVERCIAMIADIRAARVYDMTTMPVALREIRNLIRGGVPIEGVAGSESVTMAG